jgi:putative membrane protein
MRNGDWDHGMHGGLHWIPMLLMMVLVIGGIVWLGTLLLRRPVSPATHSAPSAGPPVAYRPSPQEILAERLARGEIEPDDYHRRLEALSQPRASASGPAAS